MQSVFIPLLQRILLRRIAYVDELSTSSFQIVSNAFNQAKTASERLSEGKSIFFKKKNYANSKIYSIIATLLKEQATQTQSYAVNIFKSLTAIEKYLEPEDRIDVNEQWPELNELRHRSSKSTHTPFDRLTKSTTTNDLTMVGTSTLPILERVVVNGEPSFTSHEDADDLNTENNPNTGSSPSSSLALSRLRGISSRSIQHALQDP